MEITLSGERSRSGYAGLLRPGCSLLLCPHWKARALWAGGAKARGMRWEWRANRSGGAEPWEALEMAQLQDMQGPRGAGDVAGGTSTDSGVRGLEVTLRHPPRGRTYVSR